MTRLLRNLNLDLLIIACVATQAYSDAGSVRKSKEPILRFTPVSRTATRLSKASSLTQLNTHSAQDPGLGMACSDALVSSATISSSSCAKVQGICTSGPLESVMDGATDHAWRPENVTANDYLDYQWPQAVIIRYVQTSGLAASASVSPACNSQCGAPQGYHVQYQTSAAEWAYYVSFKDERSGQAMSELDGEARPPDAKMNALTPPVESNHIRLRFISWVGEKVAVRASIRGCLASSAAGADISLNAPFNNIFPAVYADVATFANELAGLVSHESDIHCSVDQIAIESIGPSTGSTYGTGSVDVRVLFLPKATAEANEEPLNCVAALGTVVADATSELAKWAADIINYAHPLTVPTCATLDCGKHGTCAAGSCFCHEGFTGADCSVDAGGGYASTAAGVGSTDLGYSNTSTTMLKVTSEALGLQYTNTDGEKPTEAQLNAEMEQVAENLREDKKFDEIGFSATMLNHGILIYTGKVVGALVYLALVIVLTKAAPGAGGDSIKDLGDAPPAEGEGDLPKVEEGEGS
jgi:hypothetical protein